MEKPRPTLRLVTSTTVALQSESPDPQQISDALRQATEELLETHEYINFELRRLNRLANKLVDLCVDVDDALEAGSSEQKQEAWEGYKTRYQTLRDLIFQAVLHSETKCSLTAQVRTEITDQASL